MKRLLILIMAVALSACGVSQKDFSYDGIKKVDVEGASMSQVRMSLTAAIGNDSRTRLTVSDGTLNVTDKGQPLMEITMRDAVTIDKRGTYDVIVPLSIKFKGALGALGIASTMKGDLAGVRVSGKIKLRAKGFSKTVTIDDVPLKQFLASVGVSDLNSLNLSF